jgi:hypothetical protein
MINSHQNDTCCNGTNSKTSKTVPEEGTLGAESNSKAHLDKLPEGRWCKGYTFGGIQAT